MVNQNKFFLNYCIASICLLTYFYFFPQDLVVNSIFEKKDSLHLLIYNNKLKSLNYLNNFQYTESHVRTNFVNKNIETINKKIILKSQATKNFLIKIYQDFEIYKLENSKIKITNQELQGISKKLEESGYFQKVTLKNQFIQDCQIISFILIPNPKINYISFPNKSLVVSKKEIEKSFTSLMGLPKSLKKLNEGCKTLKQKYLEKGFNWSKLNLRNTTSNTLELNILEGIIDHVQFYFISQTALNRYNLQLIQKQLNLECGTILNTNTLEQGLKHLKEAQICSKYKYKVSPSFINKNDLLIKIKLYELPQFNSYIFARQMLVGEQTFDNLMASVTKSLLKYFQKNSLNPEILTHSSYNLNYLYTFDSFNYVNLPNYLYRILNFQQKSIMLKPTHSYGFRYHIKNILGYNKQFFADLQFPDIEPLFDIYFFDPWIYFFSDKAFSFTARIFKSISEFRTKSIFTNPKQSSKINDTLNTIFINQGLEGKLNYSSSSRISLSKSLQLQRLGTKCFYIHHDRLENFFPLLFQLSHINPRENLLFYFQFIDKIYREINQQFLTLNIQLHKRQNNYYFFPVQAPNLSFKISHFLPLDQSIRQGFAHKIQCNNCYCHNCTFFRFFDNKEVFIINSEIGWVIGNKNSLPFSEKSLLSCIEIIRGYENYNISLSHYYWKSSLEYHLSIQQSINTAFFFVDYGKNLKELNYSYCLETVPTILDNICPQSQRDIISMGVGLQLYTKFKKFPPLRLEYVINTLDHNHIHLKLVPQ